ncbi:MAG: hypothetical protein AAGC56_13125 [Pseudomonadota bacterium]
MTIPSKGERTREAIARAAIRILCEDGFQALTIASVAAEVGLRRNSYYTHFNDINVLLDRLSLKLLRDIGMQTARTIAADTRSSLMVRLEYVLSLRRNDPDIARALSELYVNHAHTAREIQRGVLFDLTTDRNRGIVRLTNQEADVAAVAIAAGVIELLRNRQTRPESDERTLLALLSRFCGIKTPTD